jgi:hypothetical protein
LDFSKLHLTPANHVKAAKLVRSNAASREGAERARFVQKSNTFLIAAAVACKAAGDALDMSSFEWTGLWPDWSVIDAQIGQFGLERVEAPSIVPFA